MSRATFSMKLKSTRAVRLRRRGHGDENHVGFLDAFGGAAGEFKPPGGDIFPHEFFQAGFVNRDAAGLEVSGLRRVVVTRTT